MPSGQKLSASEMVHGVLELASDLEFERISLGFPGLVEHGSPVQEPHNLGDGWVDCDYSKAFGKPVRVINDAAMQALGNYTSGRLLFLGLGTSIGTAVIVDDIVVPIEVGLLNLTRKIAWSTVFEERTQTPWARSVGQRRWWRLLGCFRTSSSPMKRSLGVEIPGWSILSRPTVAPWTTNPLMSGRSAYGRVLICSPVHAQHPGGFTGTRRISKPRNHGFELGRKLKVS